MSFLRRLTLRLRYVIILSITNMQPMGKSMVNVIHTKLGEGRRVAIPAELCHPYGIEPGDPVVLEPSEAGIVVRPLDAVIREVQAYFADLTPTDVTLSEELLRDRREEAKREERG